MEAVAAYSFLVQPLRDCEAVGDLRVVPVKGRIEAGNLKELRLSLQNRADRGQVVRLVEGREGNQALQPSDDFRSDGDRFAVVGTAVNDAMAHRSRQPSTDLLPQEYNDFFERSRYAADVRHGVPRIDQGAPLGILGQEPGSRADAIDLALHAPIKPIMTCNSEQLELDARAARVDDEDGVLHR